MAAVKVKPEAASLLLEVEAQDYQAPEHKVRLAQTMEQLQSFPV